MVSKGATTLVEFVLNEEKKVSQARGRFTLLLIHIENVAKIIATHIKKAGLVDILGKTDKTNVYGEEVQKLDQFSNKLFVDTLVKGNQVAAIASEELPKPLYSENSQGDYFIFIDPLDGSSNIDVNLNVGTIFSIYKKSAHILQPGIKQVAAGYILYGTSVMFVYSAGRGVNGFTLDPSMGNFLLSHPNMKIPPQGKIYSINEAYQQKFPSPVQKYLQYTKKNDYKLRYIGAMVADLHRTLLKGGIFIYPRDINHPQGKLRLMFEVNPFSFLIKQAGGKSYSTKENPDPLFIKPTHLHQRIPIAIGSQQEVDKYVRFSKVVNNF